MCATPSSSSSSNGAKPASCKRRKIAPSRPRRKDGGVGRQDLVKQLYRLGRQSASGVLTISAGGPRAEVFVLRRGAVMCAASGQRSDIARAAPGDGGELARRALTARLARLVA